MARYHVVAFDPNDGATCSHIGRYTSGSGAIVKLPWFELMYKDTWVMQEIFAPDTDTTISNCKQRLDWIVICVNLDEEIMKDLNGGDSSVYSLTQQS